MMTSSQFSNVEFAAGSMFGRRAFHLGEDGILRGPSLPAEYGDGENHAFCLDMGNAFMISLHYALGLIDKPPPIRKSERERQSGHKVAGKWCSCGIYAYYDMNGVTSCEEGTRRITAVIEGYGLVTVGSKGFKCSKAKIVAVVRPKLVKRAWLRRNWLLALLLPYDLIYASFYAVTANWLGMGIMLGVSALQGWLLWRLYKRDKRNRLLGHDGITTAEWDKFKANYRSVLIYDSVEAMLNAHPLSEPEVTNDRITSLGAAHVKPSISYSQLEKTRNQMKEAVERIERMRKNKNS